MRALQLTAAAALLIFAGGATADDAPRRKSGLWEIAVTTSGQPTPFTSQYCIDASTDELARSAGTGVQQADCPEASVTREGERYLVRSVCAMRNSTVTTTATLTGNFESAYEGEIQANYSPPLYGRSEVKSTVQAKWIGPCQ